MKEILCGNLKCKHWHYSGICNCEVIILKYSNIDTLNQGRKDILECCSYKESEEYKQLKEKIDNILGGDK